MTSRVVIRAAKKERSKSMILSQGMSKMLSSIDSTGFQFMQYCFINADRCVYYRSTLSSSRRKLVNPIIGKVARVHGARGKHIAIFCLGVSSFGNRLTTKYNV